MSNKLTALDEQTTISSDDLIYKVDDPSGTPTSKKITWANILNEIASQLSMTKSQLDTAVSDDNVAYLGQNNHFIGEQKIQDGDNGFFILPGEINKLGTLNGKPMTLRVDSTDVFNITSSGNVGIGTTSPGYRFEVAGPFEELTAKISGNGTSALYLNLSSTLGGESNYFEPNHPNLILNRASSSRGSCIAIGRSTRKAYIYSSGGGMSFYTDKDGIGDLFMANFEANGNLHSNSSFRLGDYYFWVDSNGNFRIKYGYPDADDNGTIVGTQS